MDAKSETLYQTLKKSLKPVPYEVFLKGNEFAGGLLVATLGVDICEKCHFEPDDLSFAITDLLCEGTVLKKIIGKRSLLVLGEWRFSQGVQRYKEIFYYKPNELLPHEVELEWTQLWERYSTLQVQRIQDVFEKFALTRKFKRISVSILLNTLKNWSKFPISAVMEGISTYMNDYLYADNYNEDYCTGIIRNIFNESEVEVDKPVIDIGVNALKKRRERSDRDREISQ